MHIDRAMAGEARLDDDALAAYARQGFLHVPDLVPHEELDRLRELYDGLFAARAGFERGDFFDMLDPEDRPDAASLPQLAWPSRHAPWLAETRMRQRATAMARQILPGAELVWEFAIMKPARTGAATPWHQDEASFTIGTPYDVAVSFWVALQDVDEAMGSMRYVPGSHLGPLVAHDSVGGDRRAHALCAVAPDIAGMVGVPVRAGDAVLHHSRTLHGAGPNTTERPRRALTLEFAVKDPSRVMRKDFPWNDGKWTTRDARAAAAMPLRDRVMRGLRRARLRLGL